MLARLCELLDPYPDARNFTIAYNNLVHLIDDIIDIGNDPERVLQAFSTARIVYSNNFYVQHKHILGTIDEMVNNTYADSVLWERSGDCNWKRTAAATLRHAGQDMLLATIHILHGREVMREISPIFREHTFRKHINDNLSIVNEQPN